MYIVTTLVFFVTTTVFFFVTIIFSTTRDVVVLGDALVGLIIFKNPFKCISLRLMDLVFSDIHIIKPELLQDTHL